MGAVRRSPDSLCQRFPPTDGLVCLVYGPGIPTEQDAYEREGFLP